MRFLSWEYWDFWRRHDHFRRFLKRSEVFRRRPKSAEGELAPSAFHFKNQDREEHIVIYSFYTWFSFLTWVWVNIFLEIVSSKTATTHLFQSGVRNWPAGVSRREIEVFNPQAWELAGIHTCLCRLQNRSSADFGVFKYAWTVTQQLWNEAENGVWGSRVLLFRHALPTSLLLLRKKPIVLQSNILDMQEVTPPPDRKIITF